MLNRMTLEEKARLVCGVTFFGTAAFPRLEIPRLQLLDGGTGINFEQLFGDMTEVFDFGLSSTNGMVGSMALTHVIEYFFEPERLSGEELQLHARIKEQLEKNLKGADYAPGCFPPGILLGATWDPEVTYAVGEALGKEANLYGINILLGTPNVNIHRDPLNGRLFEGYSEDPCLVCALAPELVKGVQKYGVAANVKHFAANNQETNRVGINERISERALEEIYLPGFRACVKDGAVQTVMSAYNKINGIPCTENHWLLTQKLREEWGFKGAVVSDWGAVSHITEALAAGNDLAMPGPIDYRPVYDAVKEGRLDEEILNQAVSRILEVIDFICKNQKETTYDKEAIRNLYDFTEKAAYDAAAAGIVLLENRGIFPLQKGQKVALAGSGAKKLMECGSGSAGITTNRNGNLYACLQEQLGADRVSLCEIPEDTDVVLCISRLGGMEGNDRKDLSLPAEDLELLDTLSKTKGMTVGLILNTCGPVDLSSADRDVVKGILAVFLPGMGGAKALADILTGKVNPSGKLPLTFPKRYEDTPTYLNFPGDGYEVNYGEGIYVGYRYYDKKKIQPLYPFGYGLSYTEFALANAVVSDGSVLYTDEEDCPVIKDAVTFSVDIKNTGKEAGAQVVQVYVRDLESTLQKPVKELKAFQKTCLNPGETKTLTFTVSVDDLASYDTDRKAWIAEEGYYELLIGFSSAKEDIKARLMFYLDAKTPYSYSVNSPVKVIYEHPQLKALALEMFASNNWDLGILESNYQYTANKSLAEIVPDKDANEMRIFDEKAGRVRKV